MENMNHMGTDSNANWSKGAEDILHVKYSIHKACRDGDIESLSLLLVSGQHNPLVEDEFYGWTPAHWAAFFGKLACLRRVMQVLNDEPCTSRYQQTPAHLAAYSGHPHCLQWLMRTGSNVNHKDYLGENAAHKAARTGSMECVSLLAAENANIQELNNVGLAPSALAARCGYADCSLYLERASEQIRLKCMGVIHEVQLPVVSSHAILPGQIPDKCVIMQGINGGRLPHSIDSTIGVNGNSDVDMDQSNGHTETLLNNGFHDAAQKDITLRTDISQNITPVAGRKRTREQIDDGPADEFSQPDLKRFILQNGAPPSNDFTNKFGAQPPKTNSFHYTHDNGFRMEQNGDVQMNGMGDTLSNQVKQTPVNGFMKNGLPDACSQDFGSMVEHSSCVQAQVGYDCLFIDQLLLDHHGS